ncbi:MAG: Gfo/Idh/MocA family protein [Candidatus Brocadiia bacterium]
MSADKVRIGIVGVGGMGSGHCNSCQKVDEVELTGVADIDEDRAKEIGEKYDVPYFTSHEELLEADLADALVVATPHYFHPPIAIDGFKAGLHVLSEKPIGVRVGFAEKMVEAAEEHDKIFCVMFQRRTESAVRKARELVEAGELGEIHRTLLVSPEFRSQAYYDSGSWRATWAGEGGGPMMNQAPHIMDIFILLGGMPSRVNGTTKTWMHDIEVEDHADATLEYENGATGYFYVSTCEPGPGQIIQVWGEKGKLQFIDGQLSFARYKTPVSEFSRENTEMWGKPETEMVDLELPECDTGHHVILRNFARSILEGEPLISPGEVGVNQLELANAIALSSNKGEAVDIPIDREAFNALMEELAATSSYDESQQEVHRETDPQFDA